MKKINILLIIITMICVMRLASSAEPVNYKCGISVLFSGERGVDWEEEVFWHKPLEDDSKVVFIKDITLITMKHNERNELQAGGGEHTYIGENGGGQIRYSIDRDYQRRYLWAERTGSEVLYPAYDRPFSFSELSYGTGYADDNSNVPVVGSVGNNGGVPSDRRNFYCYGQLDEFGDEWHTITYADDDADIQKALGRTHAEIFASDGKLILFVVNPKTPSIRFVAGENGQFYTTPAKIYQVPKIHSQITYISDNVSFALSNITDDRNCYYKWAGQSEYTEYSGAVNCNDLPAGRHTLYFYYDKDFIKSRVIIKNPAFPSARESHGYLLWENDAKFDQIKRLCTEETGTENYNQYVGKGGNSMKARVDYPDCFNTYNASFPGSPYGGKGLRAKWGKTLQNAFVAKMEGFNSALGNDCAKRSKAMLLDSALSIPDLGIIIGNGDPNPCIVQWRRGYYDINAYLDHLAAYDLLVKYFKSTDMPGGVTSIEDYKIRDSLARMAHLALMNLGDYTFYSQVNNRSGMWGTARQIAALIIAVTMPAYSTPYYGTSGFDNTRAEYLFAPYPEQAYTWKEVLFLEATVDGTPLQMPGFPNLAHNFGLHEQFTTKVVVRSDGQELPVGSFTDRRGYAEISAMGHCFQKLANIINISPLTKGKKYPYMEAFFKHCNDGTLYGLKSTGDEAGSVHRNQLLLINERFPDLAAGAQSYIDEVGIGSSMLGQGVWGLVFYNPEWRQTPLPATEQPGNDTTQNTGIIEHTELKLYNNILNAAGAQTLIKLFLAEPGNASVKIFDSKGKEVVTLWDGYKDAGSYDLIWTGLDSSGSKVGSGVYMVHMRAGSYKETKKIVIVR